MPSSATAGATVEEADTAANGPRRFPLPCWTQAETLVLIDAYGERWHSLRRTFLRTPDWDAVAAAVTDRCADFSQAKTSAQCRHKMEKLRQRHRAEKQRSLSYPYISPWFFFDKMEAMENRTNPSASVQNPEKSTDGSLLNSYIDQNLLKSEPKSSKFVCRVREPIFGVPILPLKSKSKNSIKIFPRNTFAFNSDIHPPGSRIPSDTENCSNIFVSPAGSRAAINGSKRCRDAAEELAASIRILGQEMMKMEQAKMEMAKEMETTRLEMEIKRNETILKSQEQIVDTFVNELVEMKKNKKMIKTGSDSADSAPT